LQILINVSLPVLYLKGIGFRRSALVHEAMWYRSSCAALRSTRINHLASEALHRASGPPRRANGCSDGNIRARLGPRICVAVNYGH
jgi:hypothetical protein